MIEIVGSGISVNEWSGNIHSVILFLGIKELPNLVKKWLRYSRNSIDGDTSVMIKWFMYWGYDTQSMKSCRGTNLI